jgi:RimJ/RimL family protein N-acetyltransferase
LTPHPSDRSLQWPLQKVVLQGYSVRLAPVDKSHLDQLSLWSAEEDVWRYMTFAHLASREELQAWISTAMDANERGTEMNFAIIDEASRSAIGTTSFYNWERRGSGRLTGGPISTRQRSISCSITPSKRFWPTGSN